MSISRILRNSLVFLLVICMVVGFVPGSALAAKEKVQYVSIGDSMATGFTLGNGYNSTGHNGFNEVCTKAYPYLVAKHYGWDLTQLASGGMRAEDLHYALEVGNADAYPGDAWTQKMLDNNWNGKEGVAVIQDAVAKADVISLALGNANLGIYLMHMLNSIDSDEYAYANLENAVNLIGADGELKATIYDIYDAMVAYLSAKIPKELAEIMANRIAYVATSFMYNYTGSLNAIFDRNPDVEVMVVGMMNNLSGCEVEITYNGETSTLDFAEILDLLVNPLNLYLAALPTVMQVRGEYAEANLYYAELDRVDCVGTSFKADFEENKEFYLSYFVPDITKYYFPTFGLDKDIITWQEVYDYLQKGDNAFKSAANAEAKILAANLYLMLQDMILDVMGQKLVVNLDELQKMELPKEKLLNVSEVIKHVLASRFDFSKELKLADLPELKSVLEGSMLVKGIMNYYGCAGLASGMFAHPSAAGHAAMKDMIVSSFDAKYTTKEETIVKIGKLLDRAYNDPMVQAAIAEASSGKIAVKDTFKYVALGDGTAVASGYPELLNKKLVAKAAELDITNVAFKNLSKEGNTVTETMANLPAEVADANLITLGFSQAEMLGSALANAFNEDAKPADWIGLLGEDGAPYVEKALSAVRE